MILHLTGYVSNDMFDILCDAINKCGEKDDRLKIYLNSKGGNIETMESMIHLINDKSAMIDLIVFGSVQSAAFYLLFRVNCARTILPGTQGMVHKGRVGVEMVSETLGFSDEDVNNIEWVKKFNNIQIVWCKELGLNIKEVNQFKKGESVYLDNDRMNELLELQNNG